MPALEHLFELQSETPNSSFTVIEAWSVDSPNHGRAAIANEAQLIARPEGICESCSLSYRDRLDAEHSAAQLHTCGPMRFRRCSSLAWFKERQSSV